jgi:hypothetical protein
MFLACTRWGAQVISLVVRCIQCKIVEDASNTEAKGYTLAPFRKLCLEMCLSSIQDRFQQAAVTGLGERHTGAEVGDEEEGT